MFRLFKKTKKIYEFTEKEVNFFREVIKLLPNRYHYLINQLNNDFLISFKPNDLNFKDWYSVQLNAKLEESYGNPNLGYFQLQNIFIFNKGVRRKKRLYFLFLKVCLLVFFLKMLNLKIMY
ncbi:hypothetical protein CMU21_05870 [Elizabethkingia anophelis]|nr:hypothetical protein [Elizabethkingia anophelis]